MTALDPSVIRTLLGDPDADEPNGILDRYEVRTTPMGGRSILVTLCRRDHGDAGDHVMAIMRDTTGNQAGLSLAELVAGALEHEHEEHDGPDWEDR